MSEQRVTVDQIASRYDIQSAQYNHHADTAYSWLHLERPAFDARIGDLYTDQTRVIDWGCGTGTVMRHLISKGILPQNITGIDVSRGQLEYARTSTPPEVTLLQGAIENLDLPSKNYDLVVSNMMLHCLDNEMLERALDKIYDILMPGGSFFFVATDPDHNERGRNPKFDDTWSYDPMPWGGVMPFFNRSTRRLLNLLDLHGFDYENGWMLPVIDEFKLDWRNYLKYAGRSSRMAGRYRTVSPEVRELRMSGKTIPSLI